MIWNSGNFGWSHKRQIAKVPYLYARIGSEGADFYLIGCCTASPRPTDTSWGCPSHNGSAG